MEKIFEDDIVIKTHRTIEIEKIEGTDFAFYMDTREIDENGKKSVTVYKNVTSIENINAVKGLQNISNQVAAPNMYRGTAIVAAIRKDNFKALLNGNKEIMEVIKYLDDVNYPVSDDYVLVLWSIGSYKIADLHYNFISIPIRMEHVDDNDADERYDLDKLLEKLKQDKNVCDRDKLKISDIGQHKSMEFKYLLPNEVYKKVANKDSFYLNQYILKEIIGADDCKICLA